jgi:hypothetical protein
MSHVSQHISAFCIILNVKLRKIIGGTNPDLQQASSQNTKGELLQKFDAATQGWSALKNDSWVPVLGVVVWLKKVKWARTVKIFDMSLCIWRLRDNIIFYVAWQAITKLCECMGARLVFWFHAWSQVPVVHTVITAWCSLKKDVTCDVKE